MKTVPSLVASSTIGVAAAGLVLGKPQHPSSQKQNPGRTSDVIIHNEDTSSPASRPGTSCTIITPEPQNSSSSPSDPSSNPPPTRSRRSNTLVVRANNSGRRFSNIKNREFFSARDLSGEEVRRDSISSRSSWMKRLSTIPNSYNNSPRSSFGPDSPSVGSFAPILSPSGNNSLETTPNKLVKRKTSERAVSGPEARGGLRAQIPTLRRPATSHQRSVTLKQQFRDDSLRARDPVPSTPASHFIHASPTSKPNKLESPHAWRLYFESRPTKLAKERASGRSSEGGAQTFPTTSKRVIPDDTFSPTLMKPAMISTRGISDTPEDDGEIPVFDDSNDEDINNLPDTAPPATEAGQEEQKRARRSLSLQFGSPSTWIPRSGSLRTKKRNPEGSIGGQRNSSAPTSENVQRISQSAHGPPGVRTRPKLDQNVFQGQHAIPSEDGPSAHAFAENFQARSRNTSSPLPPLTRLSSFNVDLARLGPSSSLSSGPQKSPTSPALQINTTATSISSAGHASSHFAASTSNTARNFEVADRASTLIGSDNDNKGFVSGEDDETDFQSETVFDSLRSGATGSRRSHDTPLDSMFDESPPSVNGHAKAKRLSIHELLANEGYHNGNRIVEEEEGMSTPVRGPRSMQDDGLPTPIRLTRFEEDVTFPSSPPSFSLATKDFGNLSFDDDDEDEDWTKDDETFEFNHQLSPPSNSLNARRISPHIRASLAGALKGGNGTRGSSVGPDRPKSNLFDWAEPSSIEKVDVNGNFTRPKTAHVKQSMDERGGRFAGRRGPSAVHVRSQSVPVVPDSNDKRTKLIPKFGTWGLGAKAVSEDWDNDFVFDNPVEEAAKSGDTMESSGMLVPPAIQASQDSITGHVSQIREVCLLVEQLKKLRVLGKEKDLLTGTSAPLWLEADGIITLASASDEESKEADQLPIAEKSSPEQAQQLFADSSENEEPESSSDGDDDEFDETNEPVRESIETASESEAQQTEEKSEVMSSILLSQSPVLGQFDEEMPETESIPKVYREAAPKAKVLSRPHTPLRVLNRRGQSMGLYDGKSVRESVFSPDDDIFGIPASTPPRENLKPPKLTPRSSSAKSSHHHARSLMETMHQQRAASDPLLQIITSQSPTNKLPFDTTSLRDLVQRANVLVRALSDVIRKADRTASPEVSPHRDSSPAFTRVFTDPSASPHKHMPRSQSNNSVLNGSIEASPSRSLGQRMHMMTVV